MPSPGTPRQRRNAGGVRALTNPTAQRSDQCFERLNTPEEAYAYKLGATLKMEEKVLEIEHHEIGVYENLIINATAMGRESEATRLAGCRRLGT